MARKVATLARKPASGRHREQQCREKRETVELKKVATNTPKQKRTPRPQLPLTRRLYSVAEFCLEHRISRSNFYNLQNQGRAPAITKIGHRVMISTEAAAAWRAALARATQK